MTPTGLVAKETDPLWVPAAAAYENVTFTNTASPGLKEPVVGDTENTPSESLTMADHP